MHGFKPPVATDYGNDVDMKLPDAPVHGFNPPGAVGSHGAVGQKLLDKPLHGFMPPSASGVTAAIELASAPLHGFKPPGVASDGKNEKKKTSMYFVVSTAVFARSKVNFPSRWECV